MTVSNTYIPEDTKVQVHNKQIEGFIEGEFLHVSPNKITLRLSAFSASIPHLIERLNTAVYVKVEAGLDSKGERLTYLDQDGAYRLTDYNTLYDVGNIPVVTFTFTK